MESNKDNQISVGDLSLGQKLLAIQNNLKVTKNMYSEFGNFTYSTLDDILDALRPLLAEYGCVTFTSQDIKLFGERVYIETTLSFCDVEDTTKRIDIKSYAREPLSKPKMDESQVTGSATTYAQKMAYKSLFNISDEKDADQLADLMNRYDKISTEKAKMNEVQIKEAVEKITASKTEEELLQLWDSGYNKLSLANPKIKNAFSEHKKRLLKRNETR